MSRAEILIADDNEQICEFLAENILTPQGYNVRIAADGEAALLMVRESMPDLIITDHQMPKLTGVELILKLKDEMPFLPVILITGEGSEELAAEALRAGAVNYLIKPFGTGELLEAVELALEEGGRRRKWLEARLPGKINTQVMQSGEFEAILTQAQSVVIVVDETLRLLWMNPIASQALGIDEDAMGNTITEITEDQQLIDLLHLRDDLPRWEEIELQDGKIYNIQRIPIDSVGQAIVMHDISHLKKIDRIKSEFVTTVSHDLRSPLAAILGYVELIEQAGSLDEQQKEFMRRIHIGVDQITNLVTNLLDLERIEAGLDESKEPTSVRLLAGYALEGVRSKAVSRGLTLEDDLQEDLPMVMGDPFRLRQMIGNLLDNAIKYTEVGGKVRMECYTEGDQIILRVSDSGIGIVPSEQALLFEKFYRGSNIPEAEPGTGLGLSIVKSIVENHNGRIWVESKLGSGSTFIVVLPTASQE